MLVFKVISCVPFIHMSDQLAQVHFANFLQTRPQKKMKLQKKVSSQVKINNSACSSSVSTTFARLCRFTLFDDGRKINSFYHSFVEVLCLIVRVRACTQSETKCISAPTLLALLPLAALYRHKRHCVRDLSSFIYFFRMLLKILGEGVHQDATAWLVNTQDAIVGS